MLPYYSLLLHRTVYPTYQPDHNRAKMQSPMIPSNISHLTNDNNNSLKSKLDQAHQLKLFTPPQSSRSSFAQLPPTQSSLLPSRNTPMLPHGDPLNRFDHLSNPRASQSLDEYEYDDDTQTAMEEGEGEDDDDDDDEFETDGGVVEPQFARLASLREPSPSGTLLLSTEDPEDFDVLDINDARQTEAALVALSGPISSTLTQYRNQFNRWELRTNPPDSVIHASIMIDQCLAKFVYTLEPLRWISDDLFQFGCFLDQLSSFLAGIDDKDGQLSIETITQLWNGLSRLSDHLTSVEEGLSDSLMAINELCDWVDGLLTPALAEVKFPNAQANAQVSKILDVHSYLCESLVKACAILQIYLNCLHRIECSISRFQSILSNGNNDSDLNCQFPVRQALVWSSKWTTSLTPITNSLSAFRAISECIQAHCAGHFSSKSSNDDESAVCGDKDSVLPYSQHSLTCFDTKPGFQYASISYT